MGANELLSSYYAGELDRIELIYTSFISMISSVPSIRTLIPLSPAGIEMEGDEIFKLSSKDGELAIKKEKVAAAEPMEFASDMIFEQEPSQLLNAILPLYPNGQMLRSLQESVASELAARMTAMQAASDNAKDLKSKLEQEMNRARQAKITQELMEIIAGADSLNWTQKNSSHHRALGKERADRGPSREQFRDVLERTTPRLGRSRDNIRVCE